jgi:RNA polymerase sigma factor (TIGR02999 family)
MEQIDWQSRSHFFAVAAKVMRHVLVDHARSHQADKRGKGFQIVGLDGVFLYAPGRAPEILALDDALGLLAKLDPRQCQVVELRFFAGLTEEEIAELLGISARTVKREWRSAKAWLFRQLSPKLPNANEGGVPLAL